MKPLLVPRRLPRLLQGKKGVDDPIDGTYQRQNNPVARTTGAKGNGRIIDRHQGGFSDDNEASRIELPSFDLGERRSCFHLPKSTDATEESKAERCCRETSGPEGNISTALGSKSPQISF